MWSDNKKKSELMQRAVSSTHLLGRADSNTRFAKNEFNRWVESLLDGIDFSTVLDVCCGTGNQLVILAGRPGVNRIVGVDISKDSLDTARKRLSGLKSHEMILLKEASMEKMFDANELTNQEFDLATCFYGLYYTDDPAKTLNSIIDHVVKGGHIIIAGPYGRNNEALFSLLLKHMKLPELVLRSSSTFMDGEVYPVMSGRCKTKEETFVNPIAYPSSEALLAYWRSSTFYDAASEGAVKRDIEDHFSRHAEFVVEKHVKAYIGEKIR